VYADRLTPYNTLLTLDIIEKPAAFFKGEIRCSHVMCQDRRWMCPF